MQCKKLFFKLWDLPGGAFHEQHSLSFVNNIPLPAVDGLGLWQQGGAGDEALIYQGVGDKLGLFFSAAGGED
jgi:hypothetical protein